VDTVAEVDVGRPLAVPFDELPFAAFDLLRTYKISSVDVPLKLRTTGNRLPYPIRGNPSRNPVEDGQNDRYFATETI
jgi:hypothetical protein